MKGGIRKERLQKEVKTLLQNGYTITINSGANKDTLIDATNLSVVGASFADSINSISAKKKGIIYTINFKEEINKEYPHPNKTDLKLRIQYTHEHGTKYSNMHTIVYLDNDLLVNILNSFAYNYNIISPSQLN